MPFEIEKKLVVAVSSSALFKLDEADGVFRRDGLAAYRKFQREHEDDLLRPGVAFPFVRRFLELNNIFPEEQPVEVVLLSHNDPDTGMRVFHSIDHYRLAISRAAFTTGSSPFEYIPAYNVSLFLSASEQDVRQSIKEGFPAGQVLESCCDDDPADTGLRVAFDFDGVIADDSAEQVFKQFGIDEFYRRESESGKVPHAPGPLGGLFRRLGNLRKLEDGRVQLDPGYRRYLKTAIVTARSAPAHRRVAATLREWNITADETFFLGGMDKGRILARLRPHIFFDDQRHPHLDNAGNFSPSVHVPL